MTCEPKGVFMKTAKDVLKSIKDNDVKYVDLRFTDPRGKWQHVTFDIGMIEEDTFAEGLMFDGSSIAGWKAINESDMCLMPDPVTATIDPFFAETTLVITCDVLEPTTGEPYNRDPRGMAKKAEAMVKSMGVGDTVFFGPEAEFFVFDDVRFQTTPYNTGFKLDSSELPITSPTASAPRRATSPSRRRTRCRTCAPKCSARWPRWASRSKSITTKWRLPSTNSACSLI